MTQEEKDAQATEGADEQASVHQPHDRYFKAALQIKKVAVDLMKYALRKRVKNIDLKSLKLTNIMRRPNCWNWYQPLSISLFRRLIHELWQSRKRASGC